MWVTFQARLFIWLGTSAMFARQSFRLGKLRSTWRGPPTTPWSSTGGRTWCWPLRLSPRSWWTSWTRTAAPCATPGPSPSSTPTSRGTSPTSRWSRTGSAPPPSWLGSPPFRCVLVIEAMISLVMFFSFQNYLNESLKILDKSLPPASLGLSSHHIDSKPSIHIDSKAIILNHTLEKKWREFCSSLIFIIYV